MKREKKLNIDTISRDQFLQYTKSIWKHQPELMTEIDGNKDSLVELFVIFLDNAIKYSPDKTAITLTSKKTAQQISVSIADQGIGIEESDILNIFDRFYRVNKSRNKDRVTGYGLGLSIAKQIVEKYNGNISVKSKINSGTTFTINFPAEQPV